jgi:hypothetical protein
MRTGRPTRGRLTGTAPWIAAALYLLDLGLKVIALGVVPRNRRPSSGMAWLLLILVLPIFGWVIYLCLGRTHLERRRNEQQAEVNALVAERTADIPTLEKDFPGPAYVKSVATLNRNLGAQQAMPGNRVDLFSVYMDMRSFGLNYEVSLMLLGPEVVAEMRKVEDTYRAMSKELVLEDWLARSRGSPYKDNAMRLTAALQ